VKSDIDIEMWVRLIVGLLIILLHGTTLGAILMLLGLFLSFLLLVVFISIRFVRLWKRVVKKFFRSKARASNIKSTSYPLNNGIYLNKLNLRDWHIKNDSWDENIQLNLNEREETMNDFDRSKDIQFNALACIFRGQSKLESGDIQGAIDDFDLAIEINPDEALAYLYQGKAKLSLGDIQAAINNYDRTIVINPDYALAYFHRGNAKSDLEDLAGALADYDRAIELNLENDQLYINQSSLQSRISIIKQTGSDPSKI
jgi:tetratricopeptide (TPR) repeat protein